MSHEHSRGDVVHKESPTQLHEFLKSTDIGQDKQYVNYLALVERVTHILTDVDCNHVAAFVRVIVIVVLNSVYTMELWFFLLAKLEEGILKESLTLTHEEVGFLLRSGTELKEDLII